MFDDIRNLFSVTKDPRREAMVALGRLTSRYGLARMGFDSGHEADNREKLEYPMSLGVWLFPCHEEAQGRDISIDHAMPAVSANLRAGGVGILTPMSLGVEYLFVAIPDEDSASMWNVFKACVRHETKLPGGWSHTGLRVDRLCELNQEQRSRFGELVKKHAVD